MNTNAAPEWQRCANGKRETTLRAGSTAFSLRRPDGKPLLAAGFQARAAHCSIEARPPVGWDKGRASVHILRSLYGPSWSEQVRVIYIGDDQTDEDAFLLLSGLAYTFRVSPVDSLTAATRTLPNVEAVCALLR